MTLIFGIHYFLWYGSLATIFGYEGVYARHYTNASIMQYGYLKMFLPFATVVVTPIICSLADRRRSHRAYFTLALLVAMSSMILLATLTLIINVKLPRINSQSHTNERQPTQLNNDHQPQEILRFIPWIIYCISTSTYELAIGVTTCLADSFAVLQAEEYSTNFGRIIVFGTFGWASSALVLSYLNQTTFLPRFLPGLLLGIVLISIDVVIISLWRKNSDFKLDIIPRDAARTLTGSSSSVHIDPMDYLPSNESTKINLGTKFDQETKTLKRQTSSAIKLSISQEIKNCKKINIKTATMQRSQNNRPSVFESLGLKPSITETDPLSLDIKTINSDRDLGEADVRPIKAIPLTTPFVNIDLIHSQNDSTDKELKPDRLTELNSTRTKLNLNDKSKSVNFRLQLIMLYSILVRRKSLTKYLVLFTLSGFFMAMHWNYFFLYLETIYQDKFEFVSALSMVGQSILGELPFFILSRKFIDNLGRSYTLSVSVITIGIRFLLYAYMLPNVSVYCIFLADCLQGPNYGLFYVVMSEVGLEYSYCDDDTIEMLIDRDEINAEDKNQIESLRLSLRSTIQSIAFACYEGIGVGLGSLAGSGLANIYGFRTLWLSMGICAICVGIINVFIEIQCHESDPGDEASDRRDYKLARQAGTLQKVASPRPVAPVPIGSPNRKHLVAPSRLSLKFQQA